MFIIMRKCNGEWWPLEGFKNKRPAIDALDYYKGVMGAYEHKLIEVMLYNEIC